MRHLSQRLRWVRTRQRRQQMPHSLALSLPEMEQALRVIYQAWQTADSEHVELCVPPELSHLSREDWEHVAQLLSHLQMQQEHSPLQ